jgi:uncharacterized membrane protein
VRLVLVDTASNNCWNITANTAAAVGSLIFFITYLPYTLQQQQSDELSAGAVLGSSLLANSGLSFGLSLILKFEAIEEGI